MRFVLRRLAQLPLVLLGISLVVFGLMALLPGDPASAILGPYATPERVAELRAALDLDRPLAARYVTWLGRAVRGDLGHSVSLERPVTDEVLERFAATALLAGAAFALCAVAGLVAGVLAARHRDRWPDRALTLAAVAGLSMPPFWLALLAVGAFAVWIPALPASGMFSVVGGGGALDLLRHLLLPALVLSVVAGSVVARVTRTAMVEVAEQDYLRVARAKGLPERRVLWVHAFRNALVQIVPVLGLQAGYVLGGAVYVETVFQWPGLGRMLVEAVQARDLVLVQGGALVMAVAYVLVNLAADLAQGLLDPRIRR
jgi:peptide/nickel transport system permease protein